MVQTAFGQTDLSCDFCIK